MAYPLKLQQIHYYSRCGTEIAVIYGMITLLVFRRTIPAKHKRKIINFMKGW